MQLNEVDLRRCFEFVSTNDEKQQWTGVKLLDIAGKYKNIIYKYGKVEFGEETESGEMPLTFHYDVLYSPEYTEEQLQKDLDFKNLIGGVLTTLIERQLEDKDLQYVNTDN